MTGDQVAKAFGTLYFADRCADLERPLDEYQQLFPGHEDVIAREHEKLSRIAGTGMLDPSPIPVGPDGVSGPAVGPYRLGRRLGRGGQGDVYLATDTRIGRDIALKLLPEAALASPSRVKRFEREARVASRLEHPGICRVYDAGVVDGVPYMAMQYVDGQLLAEWNGESEPRPVSESVNSSPPWPKPCTARTRRGSFIETSSRPTSS